MVGQHYAPTVTLMIARLLQQALRVMFGIPENSAHRALDDAQVLQQIVPHLLQRNATDFDTLMSRDSKCSGTFEDILGDGETSVFDLIALQHSAPSPDVRCAHNVCM